MSKEKFEPKLGDEIPEELLKKAIKEIKSEYKTAIIPEFRGKKDVEMHIYKLNSGEESIASDAYSRAFNRLIKDNLMTKKQMIKTMEEKDIWGKEQERKIEQVSSDMYDVQLKVAKMRKSKKYNKATMNKLRTVWFNLRQELNDLYTEKNSLLSNSLEGRAEEEELKVKLSLGVRYPDNSRVWENLEAINQEKDRIALLNILNHSIVFWAGLTQEIINDLPTELLFGGEETSEKLQEA